MILRRIRLENIRSYISQEIAFPEGSLLLSGDIGSGKSTILLAADFALFGIQKGLTGASLLRHGKDEGSVELDFEVGGREYAIRRTLKRKKGAVRQATGHVISGGVKKDLTAQEAKSFIIGLLGYPPQAVQKDSALIYRYTVYTPQEQMRQIIEADAGDRLDLIRRLFGIDKYKRIAENAELFAKEMRGRARELSGSIADLDAKKKERAGLAEEAGAEEGRLKAAGKRASELDKDLLKKKKELDELRDRIEETQRKKQEYASLKKEYDMLKEAADALKEAAADTEPKLETLKNKLEGFKGLKKPGAALAEIERGIKASEKREKELLSSTAALRTEIDSLSEILEKGVCGTCKQRVADRESFRKGIEKKKTELARIKREQEDVRARMEGLRKGLKAAQDYDTRAREKQSLEERWKDLLELKRKHQEELEEKQSKLKALAGRINLLAREIKGDGLSREFKEKRVAYEELRAACEEAKRRESVILQRLESLKERMGRLDREIKEKEGSKKRMEDAVRYDRWLRDFFVKLMGTIEKHVLVNVQHEFNSLFQKWFSMLVADEGLNARVDDRFAVLIEQDGYESEYSFMSGGERTAIALAYRLALNRVINDLTERIRTKDLMMLDEPTDGFSTDQMNSVRDVLDELDTRQTIIVSHEPKIESFVDQTIRFVKEDGISKAVFNS